MTEKRVSIIGCEQTFAQFKAVILTEHQPSATSLVLVTKFARLELRSAGDDFHSGLFPRFVPIFRCVFRGNVKEMRFGWCDLQTPYQMLILA